MFRNRIFAILLMFVWVAIALSGCTTASQPKNVVLFVGDGMGPEQVKAAGMYATGVPGELIFEEFPYQTQMTTYSANADVADSGASATAMATGVKVNNGVISMAIPGDGNELVTLLEYFKSADRSTGLVTTTWITHATPAAFAAHVSNRGNYEQIAEDYFHDKQADILFGAGEHGVTEQKAIEAGYAVVKNSAQLQSLDTEKTVKVSGQFGSDIPYEYEGLGELPHLSEMTAVALKILANNRQGFFLMVEGGKIDWAGHSNDIARNIGETIEFTSSVEAVLNWAKIRDDTLIVVTADHETGGLKILKNNGKGNLPDVVWSTKGHTATKVPVYAWGQGAEVFTGPMDNTDIFNKILSVTGLTDKMTAACVK